MKITDRPIRTEADYDAALATVAALMDAEPGTAAGEQLDALVLRIEAYEAHHWNISGAWSSRDSGLEA